MAAGNETEIGRLLVTARGTMPANGKTVFRMVSRIRRALFGRENLGRIKVFFFINELVVMGGCGLGDLDFGDGEAGADSSRTGEEHTGEREHENPETFFHGPSHCFGVAKSGAGGRRLVPPPPMDCGPLLPTIFRC